MMNRAIKNYSSEQKHPRESTGLRGSWGVLLSILGVFVLAQFGIFFLFKTFGRDNDEYLRLFENLDENYLEPFWFIYAQVLGALGFGSAEATLSGMAIAISGLAIVVFKKITANDRRISSHMLLACLVLAYEISFVTGALRQGISFFGVVIFLLTSNLPFLFFAILTHWSGLVYALLSKWASFALLALFILVLVNLYDELTFLLNAVNRLESYQDLNAVDDSARGFGLIIPKLLTFLVFLFSYRYLILLSGSRNLTRIIVTAPLLQLLPLLFTSNMVVIDRGGMLLDPLVFIGSVFLLKGRHSPARSLIGLMIVAKFAARITFALN